jgi:DNA-binding transcriptional LysR family regulator
MNPMRPDDDMRSRSGHLPPFASLRAFEAVFRLGGLRRAASQLGLDHSVVSRHIRSLEDWFGTSIVVRDGGKLTLTAAGRHFHDRLSNAIAELAAASAELRSEPASRQIRLWCVPGFAIQWLSGQLASFEEAHGDVAVELRPTDDVPNFGVDEADVDVRYYFDNWGAPPGGPGLKILDLARPVVFPVASPAFVERVGMPTSIRDLLDLPLLHEEHHVQWQNWLAANGVAIENPPGTLAWHAHLALDAARLGRGVALANVLLAGRELERGELVELVIPGMKRPSEGRYAFVAREARWSHPASRALRAFLAEQTRAHLKREAGLADVVAVDNRVSPADQ